MKTITERMAPPENESFIRLVGDLQTDLRTLIQKEIQLAKAEFREKLKALARNAGYAAGGAMLAMIAAFMLLLGLGAILAQLIQRADLPPGAAYLLAYVGLSFVAGAAGFGLIQKAFRAFSSFSLTPDKAMHAISGDQPVPIEIRKMEKASRKESRPGSAELETQVLAARERMGGEMTELKSRLAPAYLAKSFAAGLKHHPLRAALVGMSAGMGGYFFWKRRHAAAAKRIFAPVLWIGRAFRHA